MSPTIVIVAHYDSQSVVPVSSSHRSIPYKPPTLISYFIQELSYGADSNGSGVAVLLELARLFSKLYSKAKTQPRYNLVFLLPGGGKFSYLGSKKWIEEQTESADPSDDTSVALQNVAFVMCLDSLASSKGIFAHVSKPPKNGTVVARFLQVGKHHCKNLVNSSFQLLHFSGIEKRCC